MSKRSAVRAAAALIALVICAYALWRYFTPTGRVESGMSAYAQRYVGISSQDWGEQFPAPASVPEDSTFIFVPRFLRSAGGTVLEERLDEAAFQQRVRALENAVVHRSAIDVVANSSLPVTPAIPTSSGGFEGFGREWSVSVLGARSYGAPSAPSADSFRHGVMWGTAVDSDGFRVRYWALWW